MKNYKKVMALLMATTMVTSMAACGSKKDDDKKEDDKKPATTDAPSTTDAPNVTDAPITSSTDRIDPATGELYDLGGMEIIIRDWWSGEPGEPNSAYAEAQQEYRKEIQEKYNFTIKEQAISGWGDVFTDLEAYATAPADSNNYVFTMRYAGELVQQMKNGLYYDLSTLTSIDMSSEKWDQTVKDFGTLNGKVLTMRKMSHEPRTGVYFNKRLLQENNIDPNEIYDLQAKHEWTWAKFEEYLQKCTLDTDNDGVTDLYGFLSGTVLNDIAIASNGGNLVDKVDGKYVYKVNSENTIEALNWAIDISDKYLDPAGDRNWDYFWQAFKDGEAVFLTEQEYAAGQNLADMPDEFGFVAFPIGPKSPDKKYVDLMQDNIHVIPANYDAERANKIAFAYDLYYAPVPGFEDYSDYYASALNAFKDLRAPEETLAYMCEKTVVMFHGFVPGIDVGNDLYWVINKDNTPAQQEESIRNAWQALIDEANQ